MLESFPCEGDHLPLPQPHLIQPQLPEELAGVICDAGQFIMISDAIPAPQRRLAGRYIGFLLEDVATIRDHQTVKEAFVPGLPPMRTSLGRLMKQACLKMHDFYGCPLLDYDDERAYAAQRGVDSTNNFIGVVATMRVRGLRPTIPKPTVNT